MRNRSITAVTLFTLVCIFVTGCYSLKGGALPAHLKTIAVPVFEDRSRAGIAQYRSEFTRNLTEKIESQSMLRFTPYAATADAVLDGSILSFSIEPSQLSGTTERAITNRVTITVRAVLYDRVKKNVRFDQNFIGFADYPVGGFSAQQEAVTQSIRQITEDIFDKMVSDW
ncbi:LptE family protein [Chlorobium phaeobacteroides]|jgi:hypothetical protein|uniref:Lipoprotein n=1 Tax=Chlorobium phaeobacteroides (strain DSM 266 / SMG 266 / 2430) TaxID=290317 RepID=A1BHY5_CHLPD|nr:LptE family protein [Chlorobium phaeobacteroides]ABL66012.1 conserved hypothetical protein [Chlorobium phaeobacteroides DSM 266]MBV5326482.1 LptE family protein [Chlorobium sp.]